jgi:L-cysteine:1D-myo-inositol 2-amino-2-deoxy-alpha-D-glucopyranoside ligase
MRAWPDPLVPSLRERWGPGPAVRVHDAATGELVTIDPQDTARLYVCGITPYDATHLGHASSYLAVDLLQRAWLDHGIDVHYVQNVTDVDDPLFERARVTGANWRDLAEASIERFRLDMTALQMLAPRSLVSISESMGTIIDFIGSLENAGATYEVDGDLYFDIKTATEFGTVFGLRADEMVRLAGARGGDPHRPGKRNQLDCLLWTASREAEPDWESAWGPGRPGWHVECAAIALASLGSGFDVQGGGADLAFPHHEACAAEASALGLAHARAYVLAGMVSYDGEKMSKSLGNLVMVSHLRADGHDPMATRLALLAHHYRDEWEWSASDIAIGDDRLARWQLAVQRAAAPAAPIPELRAALTDDLDAPRALAVVDEWAATDGDDPEAAGEAALAVNALLGIALD